MLTAKWLEENSKRQWAGGGNPLVCRLSSTLPQLKQGYRPRLSEEDDDWL
jgi:hypothetical protein